LLIPIDGKGDRASGNSIRRGRSLVGFDVSMLGVRAGKKGLQIKRKSRKNVFTGKQRRD
jgi:hypothetical protein